MKKTVFSLTLKKKNDQNKINAVAQSIVDFNMQLMSITRTGFFPNIFFQPAVFKERVIKKRFFRNAFRVLRD